MLRDIVHRYRFHVITLVLVALLLEGITAAAFVFVLGSREHAFVFDDYEPFRASVTLEDLRAFKRRTYDEVTGWLPPANEQRDAASEAADRPRWTYATDARRARVNPLSAAPVEISAYGDSFTFGDSVNNDQTWPYYLSELTGTTVDNWGVGGYGTDQALLRLKANLPTYRTNVVVLSVLSENINRLMSSYRPFIGRAQRSLRLGFKPMLVDTGGALAWRPNPLVYRTGTLQDFERAYEAAQQSDYWYAHNQQKVVVGFPYTLALVKALRYYAEHGAVPDLYEVPEATRKLDRIVDEFEELARQYRFLGVVLFIPDGAELERAARSSRSSYRDYVARLRKRVGPDGLIVIDLLDRPFDYERFNLKPFKYHASPYGNRIVAESVEEAIKGRWRLDGPGSGRAARMDQHPRGRLASDSVHAARAVFR